MNSQTAETRQAFANILKSLAYDVENNDQRDILLARYCYKDFRDPLIASSIRVLIELLFHNIEHGSDHKM